MDQNEFGESNAFNTDEIRQIQVLLVLLAALPTNGKLRKIFEKALAAPQDPILSRVILANDARFDNLKDWLEVLWGQGELSPAERELVDWQASGENIVAAVQELKAVEQKLGLRLKTGLKLCVPAPGAREQSQPELSRVDTQKKAF